MYYYLFLYSSVCKKMQKYFFESLQNILLNKQILHSSFGVSLPKRSLVHIRSQITKLGHPAVSSINQAMLQNLLVCTILFVSQGQQMKPKRASNRQRRMTFHTTSKNRLMTSDGNDHVKRSMDKHECKEKHGKDKLSMS